MKKMPLIAALAACFAAGACSSAPGEPDAPGSASVSVPADAASIIGDVKEVEDGRARILVEQIPTRSAGEPIAWVDVTPQTRILVRENGTTARGTAASLAVGTRVQVWFTGPVRESFPVQATGGTILIER